MARKAKTVKVSSIEPGSQAMEQFLAAGYPDIGSRAHAQELIDLRAKNPQNVPWDVVQRAEAFLSALDARPKVIDPKPGRTGNYEDED